MTDQKLTDHEMTDQKLMEQFEQATLPLECFHHSEHVRVAFLWEEFAEDNPDLLTWKGGVLDRFYREETLRSDLARGIFIFPDKYVEREP